METGCNILANYGINGSLRKREVQAQPQTSYTEYYLFNSAANLKAYSNNGLDFAYYGYNASNTRAYKLSMQNMGQWVNGQPEPLHLQLQSAMFYPNAYINFNQNGEYTKHYYSGTERIASRLGDAQPESFVISSNDRLGFRIMQADQQARADLLELVEAGDVPIETPSVEITSLHPTNATSDIFYYHTNHLGSTAYVTDNNATITQGFLYAPFGEITTEYNANFGNNVLPKYSFNAKELDEETGMYYYEARYYKPPVFTSRDPMFEKYFWMTPYAYCANNPVKYVDPDGRIIRDKNGNIVYSTSGKTTTCYHKYGGTVTLEIGYVFANDGTPIQVFKNTTNADAGWTTNCHGTTFTDGLYWLNNDQVPALIKGDGYEVQTIENAKKGDVIIYHGENQSGEAEHSVTITKTNGTLEGTEVYGQGGLEIYNHTDPALNVWDNPTNNTVIRKTVPDRVVDEQEKMKLSEGIDQ